MTSAPAVLFLTHLPPYPASSGDAVRNWNLMRQLSRRGWRVSLFTLALEGALEPEALAEMMRVCEHVAWAPVDASRSRRTLRIARSTALRRPFHLDYFWDEAAAAVLDQHLAHHEYDLQMMQLPYMARYAARSPGIPTVFDTHNAERFRLGGMIEAAPRSPRGVMARLQIGPAARLEAWLAARSARTLACNQEEADYFDALAPGRAALIANGVDLQTTPLRREQPATANILLLGSLDYSANVDAACTMMQSVWPHIESAGARADVVGRNPPASLVRAAAAWPATVHGFVPDLDSLVARTRLLAVPLRFGGGTRLKILDAFARGIPVVSTTIGCAGLGAIDGEHLLVADDPRDFARAVDRLIADDALCESLAANGRRLVEERFDWSIIGSRLDEVLREALAEGAPVPVTLAA